MMDQLPTDTLSWIIGLLLLLLGRRIFWIFVGGVGFVTGLNLAPTLIPGQSQIIILLVAISLAIVGAILAIVLQRVAVAVAGWFAGGILAVRLVDALGWSDDPTMSWIASIVGAIIAAIVVFLLFDWALIILTSLSGAVLICDALAVSPTAKWIIGITLALIGIAVQSFDFRRGRSV